MHSESTYLQAGLVAAPLLLQALDQSRPPGPLPLGFICGRPSQPLPRGHPQPFYAKSLPSAALQEAPHVIYDGTLIFSLVVPHLLLSIPEQKIL